MLFSRDYLSIHAIMQLHHPIVIGDPSDPSSAPRVRLCQTLTVRSCEAVSIRVCKMEEAKTTQKLEKALQTAGLGSLLHTFLAEKVSI